MSKISSLGSQEQHHTKGEDLYVGFLDTNVYEAMRTVDIITIEPIRQVANSFCLNMQSIAFMVAIPYTFLLKKQMDFDRLVLLLKVKLKSTKPFEPMEALSTEERRSLYGQMKEIADQEPEGEDDKRKKQSTIDNEFRYLLALSEEIRSGYRSLLYSGLVWVWSTFEVFCSDLWEISVNESPHVLGKEAIIGLSRLDKLGEKEGLTAKYIKLDYLAKYGYDLKHSMGTILKPKFDFTSMSGIRQAYHSAFPKNQTISHVLANNDLFFLEMKRHLIVHSAGLVDEAFVSKTGVDIPEGVMLPVSDKEVLEYGNTVINAGFSLVDSVQGYLDEPIRAILIRRLTRALRFASQGTEA